MLAGGEGEADDSRGSANWRSLLLLRRALVLKATAAAAAADAVRDMRRRDCRGEMVGEEAMPAVVFRRLAMLAGGAADSVCMRMRSRRRSRTLASYISSCAAVNLSISSSRRAREGEESRESCARSPMLHTSTRARWGEHASAEDAGCAANSAAGAAAACPPAAAAECAFASLACCAAAAQPTACVNMLQSSTSTPGTLSCVSASVDSDAAG